MMLLLLAIIYLAFISLGLPDSLLGSAWPSMYGELNVPISYAGIISLIIAVGTVVSSLCSDALTKRIGAGKITAISVGMTAVALFGFSISGQFWMLCLWAVPFGLGAGSVDAALNNYVALHYSSKHMSWLHCFWGVGTIVGPYMMSYALTGGMGWGAGYRMISFLQVALTVILVLSLPLWKKKASEKTDKSVCKGECNKPLTLIQTINIRGAKEVMVTFFCYCAAEQTMMLWASSYMHLHNDVSEVTAAGLASIFFIGITVGRLINGFLTIKFTDTQMIRMGQVLLVIGSLLLLLPFGQATAILGIVLFGLGCAPIYPCIIHSTPDHFGTDKSQAMIGVQIACAYIGTCLMPTLFGVIANHISVALLPVYLLALTVVMIVMHEKLVKETK